MKKVQSPKINYFVTKVTKRKRVHEEEEEEEEAAAVVPDKRNRIEFPQHMLEDIFSILPGKSLLRFKCLSKEWKSLISSHSFNRGRLQLSVNIKYSLIIQQDFFHTCAPFYMRKHQREGPKFRGVALVDSHSLQTVADASSQHQQLNQDEMLQQVSPKKLSFFHFLPSNWEPFRVTCCCDGILCIALWNCLFLWNPYTNDYKRLPFPDPDPLFDPVRPIKTWEAFGIGYDSSIHDYKVVRVPSSGYYGINDSIVYVMTLKSTLWRKIDMDFPYFVSEGEQAIPADGHLYWPAKSLQSNKTVLIGFDLAKETFSEMPMPPDADNARELGILGGSISLAIYNECNDCFDIWIMKGQTWIKFITFPLSCYKGPGSIHRLWPLFFNQDGALVMRALLFFDGPKSDDDKVSWKKRGLIYDSKASTCKLFQVDGGWGQVFVYTESTVSLSH